MAVRVAKVQRHDAEADRRLNRDGLGAVSAKALGLVQHPLVHATVGILLIVRLLGVNRTAGLGRLLGPGHAGIEGRRRTAHRGSLRILIVVGQCHGAHVLGLEFVIVRQNLRTGGHVRFAAEGTERLARTGGARDGPVAAIRVARFRIRIGFRLEGAEGQRGQSSKGFTDHFRIVAVGHENHNRGDDEAAEKDGNRGQGYSHY